MKLSLEMLRSTVDRSLKSMHAECALSDCPATLLTRNTAQSRLGIRVGEQWYCSVDCFAEAAHERFSTHSTGRILDMPHQPRLSIGLAMLSKGYVTDVQLRMAAAYSELHGNDLEFALIRLGLANEWQLTAARAAQWGYPVLAADRQGQSIKADIPLTLLRACSAAPLHYSIPAKRLVLGFVNRVENRLMDALEQMTGCRADPCFITPSGFEQQMGRVSAAPDYEEEVVKDSLNAAQMAKTVGRFAVEVSAVEARFAQFRDCTWTRLTGKRRKVDLLFQGKNAIDAGGRKDFPLLEESFGNFG